LQDDAWAASFDFAFDFHRDSPKLKNDTKWLSIKRLTAEVFAALMLATAGFDFSFDFHGASPKIVRKSLYSQRSMAHPN